MALQSPEPELKMLVFGLTQEEEAWFKASQAIKALPVELHDSLAHFFSKGLPTGKFRSQIALVVFGRHYQLTDGNYEPVPRAQVEPMDIQSQVHLANLWFPNANVLYAVNARVPFRLEYLGQPVDDERFLGAFATSSFRDAELTEQIAFPFRSGDPARRK